MLRSSHTFSYTFFEKDCKTHTFVHSGVVTLISEVYIIIYARLSKEGMYLAFVDFDKGVPL